MQPLPTDTPSDPGNAIRKANGQAVAILVVLFAALSMWYLWSNPGMLDSANVTPIKLDSHQTRGVRWADGDSFYALHEGGIARYLASDGSQAEMLWTPSAIDFTCVGDVIQTVDDRGVVSAYHLSSGKTEALTSPQKGTCRSASWSADGNLVALDFSEPSRSVLLDIRQNKDLLARTGATRDCVASCISASGRLWACLDGCEGTLSIRRLSDGKEWSHKVPTGKPPVGFHEISIDPEEAHVYRLVPDGVDEIAIEAGETRHFGRGTPLFLSFGRELMAVGYTDGRLVIFGRNDLAERWSHRMAGEKANPCMGAFDESGRRLLVSTRQDAALLVELPGQWTETTGK